ncbi:hypothetical protein BDW02DRAFT_574253 [Decorospora gaudefroyi]|uniref:Uncharacterized protein n=1 Tax=Decorospora gaudefroyi TaxID=184978 RepID=A0A6A5JWT2_9PLEO|nr:hypothetical protein BDW02DRAFT_574253 [Decorospora gaudefroyi]
MKHDSRVATNLEGQSSSKPTTLHKRKTSTSKPRVALRSQTWSNPTVYTRTILKSRATTANRRASSDPTTCRPVTKRQSRFASLFISLLAVSPMAIEYQAADQQTIEAAQKAAVQPAPAKKAHVRHASGVRTSEIRKTRWKRFKYEMGLKMKNTASRGKGKERRNWTRMEDVEMEDMRAEEQESLVGRRRAE